jgi:hypothetical protein
MFVRRYLTLATIGLLANHSLKKMITRRGNTSNLGWCGNLPCRKNKSKKQRKKIHLIPFSIYHQ